jgi:hypothetical protein
MGASSLSSLKSVFNISVSNKKSNNFKKTAGSSFSCCNKTNHNIKGSDKEKNNSDSFEKFDKEWRAQQINEQREIMDDLFIELREKRLKLNQTVKENKQKAHEIYERTQKLMNENKR